MVQLSQVIFNVGHHLKFDKTWMQLQLHKYISLRIENKEGIQPLNLLSVPTLL